MNQIIKTALMAGIFMAMTGTAQAETPRQQLTQLVQQLQQSPDDGALREKIIKLAQTVKPAPAIPEEARRSFIKGMTFAKTATDPSQQKLAVDSFQDALKIAPWWSDAYYNLAVAQELAGSLEDAKASLKLYLLTNPGEKEARDAQDRIYALEAKQEADQKQQAEKLEATAREKSAFMQKLNGQWVYKTQYNDVYYQIEIRNDYSFTLKYLRTADHTPAQTMYSEDTCSGSISDRQISATCSRMDDFNPWRCGWVRRPGSLNGSVDESGDTMQLHFQFDGSPSCQAADSASYDQKLQRER